jgi:hypothetical protein
MARNSLRRVCAGPAGLLCIIGAARVFTLGLKMVRDEVLCDEAEVMRGHIVSSPSHLIFLK